LAEFLSEYEYLFRRADAELDTVSFYAEYPNQNVLSNDYGLVNLPS